MENIRMHKNIAEDTKKGKNKDTFQVNRLD